MWWNWAVYRYRLLLPLLVLFWCWRLLLLLLSTTFLLLLFRLLFGLHIGSRRVYWNQLPHSSQRRRHHSPWWHPHSLTMMTSIGKQLQTGRQAGRQKATKKSSKCTRKLTIKPPSQRLWTRLISRHCTWSLQTPQTTLLAQQCSHSYKISKQWKWLTSSKTHVPQRYPSWRFRETSLDVTSARTHTHTLKTTKTISSLFAARSLLLLQTLLNKKNTHTHTHTRKQTKQKYPGQVISLTNWKRKSF